MKFTESQLEQSVISLLKQQGISHTSGLKIYLQLTLSKFKNNKQIKLEEFKGLFLGKIAVEV